PPFYGFARFQPAHFALGQERAGLHFVIGAIRVCQIPLMHFAKPALPPCPSLLPWHLVMVGIGDDTPLRTVVVRTKEVLVAVPSEDRGSVLIIGPASQIL